MLACATDMAINKESGGGLPPVNPAFPAQSGNLRSRSVTTNNAADEKRISPVKTLLRSPLNCIWLLRRRRRTMFLFGIDKRSRFRVVIFGQSVNTKRLSCVHNIYTTFIYLRDQWGETKSKISVYISNILTSHERTWAAAGQKCVYWHSLLSPSLNVAGRHGEQCNKREVRVGY